MLDYVARGYGAVYSAITWGVPRTAMPSYEAMSEQHRWELALATLELAADDAARGEGLARERGLIDGRQELVAKSDAALRADFAARGFSEGDAPALLARVRRGPRRTQVARGVVPR